MGKKPKNQLWQSLFVKLKESLTSVLPVSLIVCALNFTPLVNFTSKEIIVFLICTFFLVFGIGLFNLGADLAMSPMGEHMGAGLTKTKSVALLLGVCFLMGLLITVAEPDLSVLARQVSEAINGTLLIVCVGIGVGIFLVVSVLKIAFKKSLSQILIYVYLLLFSITIFLIMSGRNDFLPLAFDSGGVTTGPITVPFIMALGVGIAATIGGKNVTENSFGLIALCSAGPIIAVLSLGLTANSEIKYSIPDYSIESKLGTEILTAVAHTAKEVAIALGLICLVFFVLQIVFLKLPKRSIKRIAVGIVYTFIGLVIFLCSANIGFMPIGYKLGAELSSAHPAAVTAAALILGAVTVLAEPAVHVLNKQVEEITEGSVSKRSMLIALSIGVGSAIALSVIRIIFDFSVMYYLIPGYLLALGLSFFVPGLYTAIAFDSGGVASGPLTSTFILPFAIGICYTLQGESRIMADAFGVVAMVALAPLITIQLLGFRSVVSKKLKNTIAMKRILSADDEQIINFM